MPHNRSGAALIERKPRDYANSVILAVMNPIPVRTISQCDSPVLRPGIAPGRPTKIRGFAGPRVYYFRHRSRPTLSV